MKIILEKELEINNRFLRGELNFSSPGVFLIHGENGVGKSTFFNFLKLHQDKYFSSISPIFVDQLPLQPINSISFEDLKIRLRKDRREELPFYSEVEAMVEDFSDQSIKSLSGGQNQLVKILIAFFLSGDIFLFDEPLQHLDKTKRSKVIEALEQLKVHGKTIIVIEHNADFPVGFIDHKIRFNKLESEIRVENGI